jgi:RimJ/RimL family protein N-acetyltransferase
MQGRHPICIRSFITMDLTPTTLEGRYVRLVPLTVDHVDALWRVGQDPAIWTYMPSPMASADEMRRSVESALADQAAGKALPFATVDRATETIVGSTRFGNIEPAHKRMEIGWTWVAAPWQRTAVNTEAKLLMLTFAFERAGCIRVELKTDLLNERSRRAILRLGASEEGTLRQHMVTPSGRLRDTVYFSILDHEWAGVKARLTARLA